MTRTASDHTTASERSSSVDKGLDVTDEALEGLRIVGCWHLCDERREARLAKHEHPIRDLSGSTHPEGWVVGDVRPSSPVVREGLFEDAVCVTFPVTKERLAGDTELDRRGVTSNSGTVLAQDVGFATQGRRTPVPVPQIGEPSDGPERLPFSDPTDHQGQMRADRGGGEDE